MERPHLVTQSHLVPQDVRHWLVARYPKLEPLNESYMLV